MHYMFHDFGSVGWEGISGGDGYLRCVVALPAEETLRFLHPLPAVLLCWQARTPEAEGGSAPLAAT